MPHDKHGKQLHDGDEVIIRAVVKEVMTGDEYCNVNLETAEAMFPGDHKSTIVLNTRQVEKQ